MLEEKGVWWSPGHLYGVGKAVTPGVGQSLDPTGLPCLSPASLTSLLVGVGTSRYEPRILGDSPAANSHTLGRCLYLVCGLAMLHPIFAVTLVRSAVSSPPSGHLGCFAYTTCSRQQLPLLALRLPGDPGRSSKVAR
jgi:hypothetical protein